MKKAVFILAALLLVVCSIALVTSLKTFAQTPNVLLTSPDEVANGSTFTAQINVYNVSELFSAAYEIRWNPADISYVTMSEGLVNSTVLELKHLDVDNINGVISVVSNVSGATNVSGSGYLSRISFKAIGSVCSTTNVSFNSSACALYKSNLDKIVDYGWTGKGVHIGASGPTLYSLTVNQSGSCCAVAVSGHINASGTVVAGASNTWNNIPQDTVINVVASYGGTCNTWNNWTGGVANTSAMSTTVTMDGNKSINANCTYIAPPTPLYNLTVNQASSCCNVTVNGTGIVSGTVNAGTTTIFPNIPSGTFITVSAPTNASCNAWNNWTGGGLSNASSRTTTVNMTANRSVTAQCNNVSAYVLTVNQEPSCCNVLVVGNGTVAAGHSSVFPIPVGATANVNASLNSSCTNWNNWIGGVASATSRNTTITMDGNKSITANCTNVAAPATLYALTVNQSASCCNVTVSGHTNASGTVVAGSSDTFNGIPQNTVLTVRAVFNGTCNYFTSWTGSVASSSAMNTTVNMTSTRTITATCSNESLYRLTVNQSSSCCNVTVSGGRETVAAGTSKYWDIIAGTIVNVSAVNNSSCNRWNNWTGGVLNVSAKSTAVNMTANRTLTAGCTYVAPPPPPPPVTPKYRLTVNQTESCCNVNVSGHANASGTVNAGHTATFSNIPSGTVIRVNASFNRSCDTWGNWSGSVANISAMNTTVTMSSNQSITANCTYSKGAGQGGGAPSWLWPVVGIMIFLTLVLFGYAANRAGWIGKPKGWFGGGLEKYTADSFGEEDVYDDLYGDSGGGIGKGTGGGSDMLDDEL